tara:strand:- start:315 stop:518 length:204 start_codon:yes stop_codon:yes gene_type:complete
MESYFFAISIIVSLLVGLKCRSKCCGKECSFELEKKEVNNETLRSIKIGRKSSKVNPQDIQNKIGSI